MKEAIAMIPTGSVLERFHLVPKPGADVPSPRPTLYRVYTIGSPKHVRGNDNTLWPANRGDRYLVNQESDHRSLYSEKEWTEMVDEGLFVKDSLTEKM